MPEPDREACLSQALVVGSPTAWDQLVASEEGLTLIPLFTQGNAAALPRRSHRVVLPVASFHEETPSTVTLPRLAPHLAEEALAPALGRDRAHDLAVLARRSMTAFRRRLSTRPEFQRPSWADPSDVRSVVPFLLVGSWNEAHGGDLEVLQEIARAPAPAVLEIARRRALDTDPALRCVGNVWYVTSAEDLWQLLASALTTTDLDGLESAALTVLGEIDPRCDLPAQERWMSFARPEHSPHLRRGIAETLALFGARGAAIAINGRTVDEWSSSIVRRLLARANADWRLWASVSTLLPLLAEAAPDAFLDGVSSALAGDDPPLLRLFDEGGDPLFSTSPHTGLLWALDRLSWASEHLARASLSLATLARLDPGGPLGNRPKASLRDTFLLWHPQTAAPWDRQEKVLRLLLEREPQSGWQLLLGILPRAHDSATSRTRPSWRDWAPADEKQPTVQEQVQRISAVVSLSLEVVGASGSRWSDLVGALPQLPTESQNRIASALQNLSPTSLSPEDRAVVCEALRRVVAKHRSFPGAAWVMASGRIDDLEAICRNLEPPDEHLKYNWLFKEQVDLLEGREQEWDDHEAMVDAARSTAIRRLHEAAGVGGVEQLIGLVESPFHVGYTLGASDLAFDEEQRLTREHLACSDPPRRRFGRGFVVGRNVKHGCLWSEERLNDAVLTPAQRAEILLCLPSERRTWDLARVDPEVDDSYWTQVSASFRGTAEDVEHATRCLMRVRRAFAAAENLGSRLRDSTPPTPSLIAEVLEAALDQGEVDSKGGSVSYWIGKLLDAISATNEVEDSRRARIEWGFAPALADERPLRTLHRELARSPQFFVDLLSLVYPAEGDAPRQPEEVSAAQRARAENAYRVLTSWKTVPGASEDGSVDPATLREWVNAALALGAGAGRNGVCAETVGTLLSHGPVGSDGAWPHPTVRDLIEELGRADLEGGLEVGRYNSRGVTTRLPTDGGLQEHDLADRYATWATVVADRWPRTAALLRRMEAGYRRDARRHDIDAELRADEV